MLRSAAIPQTVMISVIIPTLDAAETLPPCLAALVPAAIEGIVREVIVADGNSSDATHRIADEAGCTIIVCAERGRGAQLREGAGRARQPWLLFLHADTVLEAGWQDEALRLMQAVDSGSQPPVAAAFRFALSDAGRFARVVEVGVAIRCAVIKLPFGDQGLLISRDLYDRAGGFPPLPLMEDVAFIRNIPRRSRRILRARAITSARRYTADGYVRRILTNWASLTMYMVGVPIERIVRVYRGRRR